MIVDLAVRRFNEKTQNNYSRQLRTSQCSSAARPTRLSAPFVDCDYTPSRLIRRAKERSPPPQRAWEGHRARTPAAGRRILGIFARE